MPNLYSTFSFSCSFFFHWNCSSYHFLAGLCVLSCPISELNVRTIVCHLAKEIYSKAMQDAYWHKILFLIFWYYKLIYRSFAAKSLFHDLFWICFPSFFFFSVFFFAWNAFEHIVLRVGNITLQIPFLNSEHGSPTSSFFCLWMFAFLWIYAGCMSQSFYT